MHGGLLTADDLAAWRATVETCREPTTTAATRCSRPRHGARGRSSSLSLPLLAGFDLDAMGHLSPDYLHTVVECSKLAFADREAWYGDIPGVAELHHPLLDKDYNDERRRLVTDTASFELRPGRSDGQPPVLPRGHRLDRFSGFASPVSASPPCRRPG